VAPVQGAERDLTPFPPVPTIAPLEWSVHQKGRETMGTVRVYDPTATSSVRSSRMAPRPAALRGTVAGILDNGKANAGLLMAAIVDELKARHGVRDVIMRKKPVAGPASPQVIADLKANCDFVLVGSAD
jgi:hypothetical protein